MSLNIKKNYIFIGCLLIVSILLMLINLWYMSTQAEKDKQTISLAAQLRVLSNNIAKYADKANQDKELLQNHRDEFENNLAILKHIPARKQALLQLERTWQSLKEQIDSLLLNKSPFFMLNKGLNGSQTLVDQSNELLQSYIQSSEGRTLSLTTYLLGTIVIGLLIGLFYRIYSDAKQNLALRKASHRANRVAVWRLLDGVSSAINAMTDSVEQVSFNATESSMVAKNSVNIAKNGVIIVQNTIDGMEQIKGQIQDTAKQVKRLGESSQEIKDIVSLIDDIANQTNILALNAAIQAAIAGEEGHGFTVIAEEIQRLAERSSNATKKIETLVRAIQNNTFETIQAIQRTTIEVEQGAHLAIDAGFALQKIEEVSLRLAELIQNISNEAQQQAMTATKISKTMTIIHKIATPSPGTKTTTSMSDLADLASELKKAVA